MEAKHGNSWNETKEDKTSEEMRFIRLTNNPLLGLQQEERCTRNEFLSVHLSHKSVVGKSINSTENTLTILPIG
jgi:hypothetical protein